MYVEKLTMKDFRCFEQAEVSFVYPGKEVPKEALPNVTLLIGINGTGKTSVLKGVALGVLTPVILHLGYHPYFLIRRSKAAEAESATIGTDCQATDETESAVLTEAQLFTIIKKLGSDDAFLGGGSTGRVEWSQIQSVYGEETAPSFFAVGYGAMRRVEEDSTLDSQRSRRRHPRFQRVAGLFEDYITLYPLAAWYPTLESKPRQKEVRELLNDLLPEGTEFTGEFKDADAIFKHNGVKLPFGALSDGFRSYIGLVADMLYHLNYVCPKKSKLTDLSGVVMIDDIDVHLHPKWQREVVPDLAKTFPKLQFIITSHSPLVAGTLHAANIRVIEDNQIHEYTERIHGLSADQILTSSYFMLDSTRSPAAEAKLDTIAKRVADTHDPAAAIEFLKELAGKTNGHPAKKLKTGKKK